VATLFETDAAHGVRGAAAVAEAVSNGEVQTLIYARGTHLSGVLCQSCGWVMPGEATACGRCASPVEPRADLIDTLIDRVLTAGGSIEEVAGVASVQLKAVEGVGALRRFARSS
jgi:hypothetical protein